MNSTQRINNGTALEAKNVFTGMTFKIVLKEAFRDGP